MPSYPFGCNYFIGSTTTQRLDLLLYLQYAEWIGTGRNNHYLGADFVVIVSLNVTTVLGIKDMWSLLCLVLSGYARNCANQKLKCDNGTFDKTYVIFAVSCFMPKLVGEGIWKVLLFSLHILVNDTIWGLVWFELVRLIMILTPCSRNHWPKA